jgi:hypothetical protein
MLSCNQTVEIVYSARRSHMSMDICPVKPADAMGNTLTDADGTITRWCPHGVEQWTSEGVNKFWWYKPTLKNIIGSKGLGIYIQFHSNNSVSYKLDGTSYYWSPPVPALPCTGVWSLTKGCTDGYNMHSYDDHGCYDGHCVGAPCPYCHHD